MSLTKQDLKKIQGMMNSALKAQDERFSQRLMKHFYTKDEIDRKFSKVNNDMEELKFTQLRQAKDVEELKFTQLRQAKDMEELKNSQLRMEHTLIEHIKVIYDREDDHGKKLKNHEKRIKHLEETVV